MAINPESQYVGKIGPSDSEYPYGRARNITAPGDGTGTPWEAALVNDIFGFQQALLAGAAIVPSGSPDTVLASQYMQALFALTSRRVANVATLRTTEPQKNGEFAYLNGHTTQGIGGGIFFYDSADAASADNNGTIIVTSGGARWKRLMQGNHTVQMFGAVLDGDGAGNGTDNQAAFQAGIDAVNAIGGGFLDCEYVGTGIAKMDSPLTPKSGVALRALGSKRIELDFDGVLPIGSGTAHCVYADGISDFILFGFTVSADVVEFTDNGFDKYGVQLRNATNCHILNCKALDQENGILFRDGSSDCSMVKCEAEDCYYHSLGSWATSGAVNERMTFRNLYAFSNATQGHLACVSGFYMEETYDSYAGNLKAHDCGTGVRVENSCDNTIKNVSSRENWAMGFSLYNYSQRNTVSNLKLFDNNRFNKDAIDTTLRGNDNTTFSGLNIENNSNNNTLTNIQSGQTPAAEVPFTSGSDEPVLGSLLRGGTSSATGRVRRIELTSGSWGGGDAEGTMYLVETSGTFGASETVENITTIIPYNSGSERPRQGDIIEGQTSGATGEVLWPSQQSAADWSGGSSEGFIYLINVSGTFNAAEDLDNNTTGTTNIATTNGASTPVDTDIATTNGAFVAATGSNKGFQKYGIGINVRNLNGTSAGDSYNVLSNIQCLNNDINDYEDRGFFNKVSNLNTNYSTFLRNA